MPFFSASGERSRDSPIRRCSVPRLSRRANAESSWQNLWAGLPRRRAITFASCSPSKSFSCGGVSRGFPFKAISKPSVTGRCRMFSTVLIRQPKASAILRSVQHGPSASAFKSTCARRTFCDDPLNFFTTLRSVSRSLSAKRTTYFFCIATLHGCQTCLKINSTGEPQFQRLTKH